MEDLSKQLNFNLGLLGHVDCGKTSLAKALSSISSTAAFDKNPQSKARGITLDLGFSAFYAAAPDHIKKGGYEILQFTLVDCPGHASLIKTIIGGAQIIDGMVLVIDITKGIQTQTAECIVIGQILCKQMLIVLNKLDLVPENKREATISKVSKKLRNALKDTKFSNCEILALSASPGGSECNQEPENLHSLIESLSNSAYIPERRGDLPLVISLDHCFGIKGQGTVLTGTILQGSVSVNDTIEIPTLKISKKVKSIQMFRKPVEKAREGDRCGICVTQLDSGLIERTLAGSSQTIKVVDSFIAKVEKIPYYNREIKSETKFNLSLGHDTVLCNVKFFSPSISSNEFQMDNEFEYRKLLENNKEGTSETCYAYIEYDKPIPLMLNSHFVAAKLDVSMNTQSCRIAFWGIVLKPLYNTGNDLKELKIYKRKHKEGIVERMNNESELIVKHLLKTGSDMKVFSGLTVQLSTGETGVIDGSFGQSGKTKIRINENLKESTKETLLAINEKRKRKKKTETVVSNEDPIKVTLDFKKYIYKSKVGIVQ